MVIVLSLSVYAAYYSSNATGSAYASSSYTSASISGGGNDCYLVCKFNHAIRDDDRKEWTGSGSKSISHTPPNVSENGNPDPYRVLVPLLGMARMKLHLILGVKSLCHYT